MEIESGIVAVDSRIAKTRVVAMELCRFSYYLSPLASPQYIAVAVAEPVAIHSMNSNRKEGDYPSSFLSLNRFAYGSLA